MLFVIHAIKSSLNLLIDILLCDFPQIANETAKFLFVSFFCFEFYVFCFVFFVFVFVFVFF